MILAAIETVGTQGGIAILTPQGLVESSLGADRRHGETLLPALLELTSNNGLRLDQLQALVVNEGPGSFTGIRIGLAAAAGLGEALSATQVGVGCLDIQVWACYSANDLANGTYMISTVDVRRGEVAWAGFVLDEDGPRRAVPRCFGAGGESMSGAAFGYSYHRRRGSFSVAFAEGSYSMDTVGSAEGGRGRSRRRGPPGAGSEHASGAEVSSSGRRQTQAKVSGGIVRRLRPEDVDKVARLEKEIFDDAWSAASFRQETVGRNNYPLVVVDDKGGILAYMVAWFVADEVHLGNIAVVPGARRQGLANRLLSALHQEGVKRKARFVVLEVRRSNLAAQNLYQRHGYKTTMVRPGYYQDNKEDALIMIKPLQTTETES